MLNKILRVLIASFLGSRTCQMDHIRRGHEQICDEIRRGGGGEQYHAEKKYKEAVAVAVAKCATLTQAPRSAISARP